MDTHLLVLYGLCLLQLRAVGSCGQWMAASGAPRTAAIVWKDGRYVCQEVKIEVPSISIVSFAVSDVVLETGSIPQEWLLSGNPEMRSKLLVRTPDWIANVVIWECGAVSYKWHYNQDEAYLVLSGEGFMTDDKGVERRFGTGDVAYFPAGTNATWRHPDHFKKVAFLKESIPRPVGFGLKVWNKLLRMMGLKDQLALLLAVAVMTSRSPR